MSGAIFSALGLAVVVGGTMMLACETSIASDDGKEEARRRGAGNWEAGGGKMGERKRWFRGGSSDGSLEATGFWGWRCRGGRYHCQSQLQPRAVDTGGWFS